MLIASGLAGTREDDRRCDRERAECAAQPVPGRRNADIQQDSVRLVILRFVERLALIARRDDAKAGFEQRTFELSDLPGFVAGDENQGLRRMSQDCLR